MLDDKFFDFNVEKIVLGACVNYPPQKNCIIELCRLPKDFFYHAYSKAIHEAIKEIYLINKRVEMSSVYLYFSDRADDKDALMEFIGEIVKAAPPYDWRTPLEMVREYYRRRKIKEASETLQLEMNEIGTEQALTNYNKRLKEVETNETGLLPINCLDIEEILRQDPVLPTGIKDLDNYILGIPRQQITTIAARPNVGKTAFILGLFREWAKLGIKVTFFSQETKIRSLLQRMIAAETGCHLSKLRRGKGMFSAPEIEQIKSKYDGAEWMSNILVYDSPVELKKLFTLSKRAYEMEGAQVVAVDHVGLVRGMNSKYVRREQIGEYSAMCREFVAAHDSAFINLWQLNRVASDEAPALHHLKDSGSGEEDSDLVLLLSATDEDKKNNDLNIFIAKQRQGETAKIGSGETSPVKFYRNTMVFKSSQDERW